MQKDLRFEKYFLFTQNSMSTFDSCPMKFKKRYLESLRWENLPDENIKRRFERGRDFHVIAQRYFMGIPTGIDEFAAEFPELKEWYQSLAKCFKIEPNKLYLPEYKIRMVTETLKLEANFDLIIVSDDSIEIWDWKTNRSNFKSKSKSYDESLQTTVYMFVLKEQAKLLLGKPIDYNKINMCYWYPEEPHILAQINYTENKHEEFRGILEEKTQKILYYDYEMFDKSDYIKQCMKCEFNWFCNNERVDFIKLEQDDDFLEDIFWEDIEERY